MNKHHPDTKMSTDLFHLEELCPLPCLSLNFKVNYTDMNTFISAYYAWLAA